MTETTEKEEEIKEIPKSPITHGLSKPLEFQQFVVWIATPEPLREPRNQSEFAAKFGLCLDTLTDWKQRAGFWDEVKKEWDKWGKEKTNNVIARFYQKILGPDVSTADFKLWFQFFLDWSEKTEVEHSGTVNVKDMKELLIVVRQIPEGAFLEYFTKQSGDRKPIEQSSSAESKDTSAH